VRDLYVRQLWDSKITADIGAMSASDMALYARLCAWARASVHARSGDSITIGSYLGSDAFDRATAAFSEAYADQTERDQRRARGRCSRRAHPCTARPLSAQRRPGLRSSPMRKRRARRRQYSSASAIGTTIPTSQNAIWVSI